MTKEVEFTNALDDLVLDFMDSLSCDTIKEILEEKADRVHQDKKDIDESFDALPE